MISTTEARQIVAALGALLEDGPLRHAVRRCRLADLLTANLALLDDYLLARPDAAPEPGPGCANG